MIEVRFHDGVLLPELDLWLDPHAPKHRAFVSHAHSDHLAAHREVLMTPRTAALMRERMGGERIEHLIPYGESREFAEFRATLLPAGHIFGSAQIHIESDQGTLLYTGDFKVRPGLSAEPIEARQADTLIMETTYGLPKYRLPPTEEVMGLMVAFCRDAQADGAVPVLLGYSLGKSQEILCALMAAGLTPMLHAAVWRMTEVYRELCPTFPSGYVKFDAAQVSGKVLICPPSAVRSSMITRIPNRRTAVLTGWALDPGATYRYQVDAAFPLSDHADYDDLLQYVNMVQPKRVLTLHGFASAFAADLRARGIEAWALSQENQLELALGASELSPSAARSHPVTVPVPVPHGLEGVAPTADSEFDVFAKVGESIGATTSRLAKITILAGFLRRLEPAQLALAAIYLTGRAFPQNDPRVLQTGSALVRRVLLGITTLGEARLREISRAHSDAGKTTYEAMLSCAGTPAPWTLREADAFFDDLQKARGPLAKTQLMDTQMRRLSPLAASYVVRILSGDLRIGLKEGLVEEGIAQAFDVDADAVREANMLLGDIGTVAQLAAQKRLQEASPTLFRPIKVMLASPEPSADAVWRRIAQSTAWVEDKFDGIRAQLHLGRTTLAIATDTESKGDSRVEIYSRDLKVVTHQFPEIAMAASRLVVAGHDCIFDGEIVAHDPERKLKFFDLQRRLGRTLEYDLFSGANDVPVLFQAFDLLWLDGRSLLHLPLVERRVLLDELELPVGIDRVTVQRVRSADEVEECFRLARARGNEGLIIKDVASAYSPGRRGHAWLKLKAELATLDVVVVGAEMGHGKRSHVLSDYTFAIRDDRAGAPSGALLTIGKAYTGLTDAEIEELTERFQAATLQRKGRYREVRPEVVLEIAFDSIQPSDRHESGLAMRFPRIKAIRSDKTPEQIDTLSFARQLAGHGG